MTPIVDGLAREFEGRAAVVSLDADEPATIQLQERYLVRGHPSFVILDSGNQVVERFVGPQAQSVLEAALTQAISSAP